MVYQHNISVISSPFRLLGQRNNTSLVAELLDTGSLINYYYYCSLQSVRNWPTPWSKGARGIFYWMDRNLLSIRAVPKRMIFCSLLMLAAWIFSKLFTTTTDPNKHWDTCAVISISMETSLAFASVRSLCVFTICALATLMTFFIAFVNIQVEIVNRLSLIHI